MSIWSSILLGLLQGVTEFLPVSSSGHLAIIGESLGVYEIVMFHVGTLFAILVYYYRDVWRLLGGSLRLLGASGRAACGKAAFGEALRGDRAARVALLVIVASVPTAVIGLGLRSAVEYVVSGGSVRIVGGLFIITAALLYACDRFRASGKGLGEIGAMDALTVGIFQGLAVLPGLSRSGLTIFAGVMRGMDRPEAARFSFLAAIPAIAGAAVLELSGGEAPGDIVPALVGAAVAFAAGYASIVVLVRLLSSRKLKYFAAYLVLLGAYVLIWMN